MEKEEEEQEEKEIEEEDENEEMEVGYTLDTYHFELLFLVLAEVLKHFRNAGLKHVRHLCSSLPLFLHLCEH